MRIGLLGCAGLGKGTIARMVSKKLGIGLIESKKITRPILEKLNYHHSDKAFVERILAKRDHEFELVSSRIQMEDETGSFVTDRTVLECFAYSFLRLDTYTPQEFKLLEETCLENIRKYGFLYYIPYEYGYQEVNGVRTTNREFQWMADKLVKSVVERWGLEVRTPKKGTVEEISEEIVHATAL